MRRLLVATPQYLDKYGTPSTVEELAHHKYAHNNYVNSECMIRFAQPKGTEPLKITPQVIANNVWMLHAALMSNRYVALMPAFFIEEELTNGGLIPLLQKTQIESPVLSVYHHRSSFVPMKVRILINFLRRKYGEHPPWEQRLLRARPELSIALDRSANN